MGTKVRLFLHICKKRIKNYKLKMQKNRSMRDFLSKIFAYMQKK